MKDFLTFHKNTKCNFPLCGTYRPILLLSQKLAAKAKDPPPEKLFAALDPNQENSDDEALAIDFGEYIEEINVMDALTLGSTTTNLERTDIVLPTYLIENMIDVETIVDERIVQEIEDINRIPNQSIPSMVSDDITTPHKEINNINLSNSPLPAESNY